MLAVEQPVRQSEPSALPADMWGAIARAALHAEGDDVHVWERLCRVNSTWRAGLTGAYSDGHSARLSLQWTSGKTPASQHVPLRDAFWEPHLRCRRPIAGCKDGCAAWFAHSWVSSRCPKRRCPSGGGVYGTDHGRAYGRAAVHGPAAAEPPLPARRLAVLPRPAAAGVSVSDRADTPRSCRNAASIA